MSCTNPLKAFTIGINEETGKANLKICKRDVTYLERVGHSWIKHYDPVPYSLSDDKDFIFSYDFLPCGNCLSCRLDRARDWTVRALLESKYHDDNWFVTLTYNDDHLCYNQVEIPVLDYVSDNIAHYNYVLSDEFTGKSTLVKKHLADFLKRLRKNYEFDNHISFLACGEYGSITQRPHYHLCLFGLKLDDLEEWKKTDLGYSLYNSEFLNRCWSRECKDGESSDFVSGNGHPHRYIGHVVIAPLTYESAGYVARYTMKKAGDDYQWLYDDFLIEREFVTASRNPALGLQYYLDHKDEIYKYDSIVLDNGLVVKPPSYFDKLFERDNPVAMARIKEFRKNLSVISHEEKLSVVPYDFETLLGIQDFILKDRTKSLLRKEI